jgi:hypothetical protein
VADEVDPPPGNHVEHPFNVKFDHSAHVIAEMQLCSSFKFVWKQVDVLNVAVGIREEMDRAYAKIKWKLLKITG